MSLIILVEPESYSMLSAGTHSGEMAIVDRDR
jgi:hypothetical protein